MALQTMIENLAAAKKAYDAQLSELKTQGKKAVTDFLSPLVPPGYKLTWTQYTPYFNDGSPCRFGVHDAYLVRVGDEDEDESLDERGIYLSSAADKYGTADKEQSYFADDHSKPLPRKPGDWRTEYAKKTVVEVVKGFPEIEGYAKETLEELDKAWDALPKDLMEQAFGDHVQAWIAADGASGIEEYSHD